jgi:hypothetical protein
MTAQTTNRLVRLGAAFAVAGALVAAAPASAGGGGGGGGAKTYAAPFKVGPSGGDQWSYHSATADGSVTVGRVYPIPGAINCTKGGPYAKLLVHHHATGAVRKVVLSYTSAAVDNFTFIMLGVRTGDHWLGSQTVRGVVAGSGTVTLKPDRARGASSRNLTIEFGLQQSSACPNADAGRITFTKVQVFS